MVSKQQAPKSPEETARTLLDTARRHAREARRLWEEAYLDGDASSAERAHKIGHISAALFQQAETVLAESRMQGAV